MKTQVVTWSTASCGPPTELSPRSIPPGSTNTSPFAINSAGAVAGYFVTTAEHGFLRAPDGAITTFDPPGSFGTFAFEINPAGVITGSYLDASGAIHGFLRIP
jgi:hypothetical protein